MNRHILRLLCSLMMFAASLLPSLAGDRYRVSDEVLSFYNTADRDSRLGKLHKGDEFEAIGTEGSMLIFEYKGRKAYIASYCCKKIEDDAKPAKSAPVAEVRAQSAPAQSVAASSSSGLAPEEAVDASDAGKESHPATKSLHSRVRKSSGTEAPDWLAGLLGMYFLLGVVVGVWTLFGRGSCEEFFNNLAGGYVANGSTAKYFRPLILVALMSLTYTMSMSITAVLVVGGVYETILLIVRSRQLCSMREAVVEAVYLSLRGIGAVALCAIFIILALIAAGGSGSSGGKKQESRPAECRDCRHYNWASSHCERGYRQDGTCEDFSGR